MSKNTNISLNMLGKSRVKQTIRTSKDVALGEGFGEFISAVRALRPALALPPSKLKRLDAQLKTLEAASNAKDRSPKIKKAVETIIDIGKSAAGEAAGVGL